MLHAAETIKGGVATVIRHLDSGLEGDATTSLTFLIPKSQRSELSSTSSSDVLAFEDTGRNMATMARFAFSMAKAVARARPDVVHLHSSFAGAIGRLVLLALRPLFRPKVVYCPHAFAFLRPESPLKRAFYSSLERMLTSLTHAVVCVSEHERSEAIRAGLPSKKLLLIRNGTPLPEEPAAASARPDDAITRLIFVGRLDYQKGFDTLRDAMRELEDEAFHLTVVGEGVLDSSRHTGTRNVEHLGWVPHDQVPVYFSKAAAIVVPSRWEGFAMVPMEAMSHGLPIIASNIQALTEIVLDGTNGLVFKVGDSHDLASKIRMLGDVDLVKMGRAGRNIIERDFCAHGMVEKTLALYRSLHTPERE